jgi:hypothetical protein
MANDKAQMTNHKIKRQRAKGKNVKWQSSSAESIPKVEMSNDKVEMTNQKAKGKCQMAKSK